MRKQWLLTLVALAASAGWNFAVAEDHSQGTQSSSSPSSGMSGHGFDVGEQSASTFRASQIKGLMVWNPNREKLGEVNDLVIDAKTGRVPFAVISHGGTLGVGDKLVLVPIEYLGMRWDPDHKKHFLALNLSEGQMKNAPSFTNSSFPDFRTEDVTKNIHKFFREETARTASQQRETR
jgi:sporulation protein YlmC with PRC-barrel domain